MVNVHTFHSFGVYLLRMHGSLIGINRNFEIIDDEDFKKILIPFNDNYDKFLENYIMPEVIASYIANSFYRNAMWKGSFKQHYNSATDVINYFDEDYEKLKLMSSIC